MQKVELDEQRQKEITFLAVEKDFILTENLEFNKGVLQDYEILLSKMGELQEQIHIQNDENLILKSKFENS